MQLVRTRKKKNKNPKHLSCVWGKKKEKILAIVAVVTTTRTCATRGGQVN